MKDTSTSYEAVKGFRDISIPETKKQVCDLIPNSIIYMQCMQEYIGRRWFHGNNSIASYDVHTLFHYLVAGCTNYILNKILID